MKLSYLIYMYEVLGCDLRSLKETNGLAIELQSANILLMPVQASLRTYASHFFTVFVLAPKNYISWRC